MCFSHIHLPEFLEYGSIGLMIKRDFLFVTEHQNGLQKPLKYSLAVFIAAVIRITSIEGS
jgi:hypothetical protein